MSADAFFQQVWYRRNPSWISLLLLPLSWLFRALVAARRSMYSLGIARQHKLCRPVVVVGNITVGGTGKTPFTIWLANRLHTEGLRVGIVLRGYGAQPNSLPYVVESNSPWQLAGDEALVIANSTPAIVVIDPNRVRAARKAIELGADLVLSDDGLQHLRLGRDYEIAVLDAARRVGNGELLPAGPLREPVSRLERVNRRVVIQRQKAPHDAQNANGDINVRAVLGEAYSLVSAVKRPLFEFSGHTVHAVAGIGNPNAFFAMLREAGLQIVEHPFADHARLSPQDLQFGDDAPVLMTQKDAVRCGEFATERMWAVRMELEVDSLGAQMLLDEIKGIAARRSQIATR